MKNEKKEYIERGALIDSFDNCYYLYNSAVRETVRQALKNAPVADVAPVVHGEWINIVDYGGGNCVGYCSVCKAEHASSNPTALRLTFAYCRWCGAKMDGGSVETNH